MPKAGFCRECNKSIWLMENGGCQFGHSPSSISKVWDAEVDWRDKLGRQTIIIGVLGTFVILTIPLLIFVSEVVLANIADGATRSWLDGIGLFVFLPISLALGIFSIKNGNKAYRAGHKASWVSIYLGCFIVIMGLCYGALFVVGMALIQMSHL